MNQQLRVNGMGASAADDVEQAIAEVMKLPTAGSIRGPIDGRDLAQLVADAGAYRDNAVGAIVATNDKVQARAAEFAATAEAFIANLHKQFDAFARIAIDIDDSMRTASEVVEAQRERLEGPALS